MKILHLYYDLLNLYGEYANVCALERYLKQQGIEVETDRKSLGEEADFSGYDFIYTGSGTELNLYAALDDILPRKESLKRYLESGGLMLSTGNSFEMFGQKIILPDGTEKEGLGFFDFYTRVTDKSRVLTDCVAVFSPTENECVGFINKASEIYGKENSMFRILAGAGDNEKTTDREGIISGSFYGTHLTGPLLIKNPAVAEYFVKILCEKAGADYKGIKAETEYSAFNSTLKGLKKQFGL